MRMFCVRLCCAALPFFAMADCPAEASNDQASRTTLAILSFEARPAGTIVPPPNMGDALADLLLDRLVASGEYRVLDGRWLQTTGFANEPANFNTLRQSAEAAGVDYLVHGSMTRFSAESRQRTYGGGIIVPLIAGVRRQKNELVVGLLIKLIDVRSGAVVTTAATSGTSERKRVRVGALGLFVHGGGGGFQNSTSGSRDAQLDEAIQRAITQAAQGIINAGSKLTRASSEF